MSNKAGGMGFGGVGWGAAGAPGFGGMSFMAGCKKNCVPLTGASPPWEDDDDAPPPPPPKDDDSSLWFRYRWG